MGTHPIFESDFDCLTDRVENILDKMPVNQNISKIFDDTPESRTPGKQGNPHKNASDIFHLDQSSHAPNTPVGKRQANVKRDNDIFGTRERRTGEATSTEEKQLQASTLLPFCHENS